MLNELSLCLHKNANDVRS